LAVVSPLDGAILALAGGYQFGEDQFNRALDARRPAGSSFKPFVYAAALHLGWTPASLVQDEPFTAEPSHGEIWQPRNFDGKALGQIRLRPALTQSRNLATIDLLDRIGLEEGIRFAGRFGFDPAHLPRGLSLALGTAAVSPLRMAAAYAVFANGGFRVEPYLIRRIEDVSGALVEAADPPRACADCWFRGYHKDLAVVAWIGFDDFSPLGQDETGGQAAIGMWVDFMRAALAGRPEATLDPPAGLARVPIDPTTGALAAVDDANAILEWIREEDSAQLDAGEFAGPVAEDGFLHTAPPPMIDQVF
jgi:membrane carboxypeptidase/penicillin-binding protein